MIKKRIYLDTASTTPVDSRVLKAMLPYFDKKYGNPSSIHIEGVEAAKALQNAREKIAKEISGHADEIIFTSGGTESDNLAVFGVCKKYFAQNNKPGHIIVSAIEHKAVLEPAQALEREGWRVTYLPVNEAGVVDLKVLRESLAQDTVLVSVMYANNEIGTVEPLREIKKIIKEHKLKSKSNLPYFHTDACQAPRFLDLNVEKLGIDLLSANGSKIYGPKGIGFLFARRGVALDPVALGGGQEGGARSGTQSVPLAVGLAEAMVLCGKLREKESKTLARLRDGFMDKIRKEINGCYFNGDFTNRLSNNISVTFEGVDAENLMIELDSHGIAISSGSACSSLEKDSSYVIQALGKSEKYAGSTVRFTLGRDASKADLDRTVKILERAVNKLRSIII